MTIPYAPRPLQRTIHAQLEATRFVVAVCHRRFGKTVMAVNHLLKCALLCPRDRGRYYYIAPTFRQGKAVAWDYLKHFSAVIPGVSINESELRVDLPNGAQVRIFGVDNPDSLRGLYADGVVLDEYGLMAPNAFTEVIRPLLADRQGWALFIGTPNGKNQFYEIAQRAKSGMENWAFTEHRASQTGYVSADELAQARQVMTPDEYAQEFECSFEASVKGAVFAHEMALLREELRICHVPYLPELVVDTCWDIGYRDATAIWFIQSPPGGGIRVIDYHEDHGYSLEHYANVMDRKGYKFGTHVFPHDIQQHEFTRGKARIDVARQLLRPAVFGCEIVSFDDSLHAARMALRKSQFDEQKCAKGLDALASYRWHFNSEIKAFTRNAEHDWASHCADAFRTVAMWHESPMRKKPQIKPDWDPDDAVRYRQPRRVGSAMPGGRGGY